MQGHEYAMEAVQKLCRPKIDNFRHPPPSYLSFYQVKLAIFDPPSPLRRHSLWMAPICNVEWYSSVTEKRLPLHFSCLQQLSRVIMVCASLTFKSYNLMDIDI